MPIASDVDCEGGGGNGPMFVRGPIRVIGSDDYDLDRDGNGIACEAPDPATGSPTTTTQDVTPTTTTPRHDTSTTTTTTEESAPESDEDRCDSNHDECAPVADEVDCAGGSGVACR